MTRPIFRAIILCAALLFGLVLALAPTPPANAASHFGWTWGSTVARIPFGSGDSRGTLTDKATLTFITGTDTLTTTNVTATSTVTAATGAITTISGCTTAALAAITGCNTADVKNVGHAIVDDGNSGTTKTIDFTAGQRHVLTLTGSCTLTFTAPTYPGTVTLKLTQDGTGSRTVTWPAAVKWAGGTAPTLSTSASKVDQIILNYDGTIYVGQSVLDVR